MLVDWEITGIERGPMDLVVFMCLRMDLETRRAYESELLDLYYSRLTASGKVKDYSFEQFKKDYVQSGTARMAWYLTILGCFHHDFYEFELWHQRAAAFLHDHDVKPDMMEPMVV